MTLGALSRSSCRYKCVLETYSGQSLLKVVETNDFKQLAHISLLFRPADDKAIKQVCSLNEGMQEEDQMLLLHPCALQLGVNACTLCGCHMGISVLFAYK